MAELLHCSLDRIRLASLIQLAEGEMVTGTLKLPTGQVHLHQGDVVGASCGALRGVEALRELFLCPSGDAVLIAAEVAASSPLGGTLALVMEGVRVADEWDRVAPMVLADGGFEAESRGEVGPDLLALLDGERTVFEAVQQLGLPPSRVVDTLLSMVDEGWLVEASPPRADAVRQWMANAAEPQTRPDPPADYWSALEQGRLLLRGGDWDGAEAALRAALQARPDDRVATQNLRRLRALRERDSEASATA